MEEHTEHEQTHIEIFTSRIFFCLKSQYKHEKKHKKNKPTIKKQFAEMSNYQGEGISQLDFDEFYSEVLTSLFRRPDVISSDTLSGSRRYFRKSILGEVHLKKWIRKTKNNQISG